MSFKIHSQIVGVVLSFALSNLVTNQLAYAGGSNELKTCDQIYSHKAKMWIAKGLGFWVPAFTVPVFGQVTAVVFLSALQEQGKLPNQNPVKHRFRVAELLKSATLISYSKQNLVRKVPTKDLNKAEKTVLKFYEKYIHIPYGGTSKVVLDEVINRLTVLNLKGPGLGMCKGLYSRRELAKYYFANGELSIDKILTDATHRKQQYEEAEAQRRKKAAEAAQARNKKTQNNELELIEVDHKELEEFYHNSNNLNSENEMSHLTDYAIYDN